MARFDLTLSQSSRKALCVQVGDAAGHELADIILEMAARIQRLERNKVDVTHIAPAHTANLLHAAGLEE